MAKEKTNKSQVIRDAAKAHPEKTPTELAGILATQGLKVKGQYVSTILSNARKKRRRGRTARRTAATGFGSFSAALEFIKAAGGLENAKAALGTIEEIGNVVR
jgi:hypothetical protein